MKLCRYCETNRAHVKAHIIPHSFFAEHLSEGEIPRVLSTSERHYPRKSPVGEYDTEILCESCEQQFSAFDSYGYKFFHENNGRQTIYEGTEGEAYIYRDVDYRLLKLFLISVLWRASVSKRDFYAGVSLGAYEERALFLIKQASPGKGCDFPMLFQKFDYQEKLIPILCPTRMSLDGINGYQLILNGFSVWIKVDSRLVPKELREVVLQDEKPLLVLPREYKGSQEHKIMVEAARNARQV